MTNTTVLIADMAILVGIFLLGLLAKIFPKSGRQDAGFESSTKPSTTSIPGERTGNAMTNRNYSVLLDSGYWR